MDFYFNAHKHVSNLNYIHKSASTQVSIQTHQLGPFFKVLFLLGLRISTDSKTCFSNLDHFGEYLLGDVDCTTSSHYSDCISH